MNAEKEYFISRERYNQLVGRSRIIKHAGEFDDTMMIDLSVGSIIYNLWNNSFVIVKNKIPYTNNSIYGFPKGGPNKSETHIRSVMEREVYEETGLKLDDNIRYNILDIVQTIYKAKRTVGDEEIFVNRVVMFYIIIVNMEMELRAIDSDEIEECVWATVFKVFRMVRNYHVKLFFLSVIHKYFSKYFSPITQSNIEKLIVSMNKNNLESIYK